MFRLLARRDFLHTNAVLTVGAVGPFRLRFPRRAALGKRNAAVAPTTTLRDPGVKALALQAVDAARAAGAQYADVRMTNSVHRQIGGNRGPHGNRGIHSVPSQTVRLGMSVRALVNGYWGWVATPTVSPEEAVRIARLATQFAAATASRGRPRTVDLGTLPVVQDGEWTTPVKVDPFTLDLLDLSEWMYGTAAELADLVDHRGKAGTVASRAWANDQKPGFLFGAEFEKQERVLASSEGTFLTQTVLWTGPNLKIPYTPRSMPTLSGAFIQPGLLFNRFSQGVQAGFEWYTEAPLLEMARQEMDQIDAAPIVNFKPIDVGRYDCVFSAAWMAQLLSLTLAPAAEVDRTLGYEANATGTSYLGTDPLAVLGTPVASPLVTITAERSTPTGLATVKWDDEGVATQDFPFVQNGALVNYPTTREQASWLAPWAAKQGHPVQSLGCARAPDALHEPMQHTSNLRLHPGTGSATEASLIAELEHGLYFPAWAGGNWPPTVDQQCRNVFATPVAAFEVRHGKIVGSVPFPPPTALTINTNQFWKNIQVLGGSASAEYLSVKPRRSVSRVRKGIRSAR